MNLKLFKTKDGYSRVKEELEEISTPKLLNEVDEQEQPELDSESSEAPTVDPDAASNDLVLDKEGFITGMLSAIRDLIQEEYTAVESYNGAAQMFLELDGDYDDIIKVLRSIMHEEYAHIGELQKCLAALDPQALESIDLGEEEADEIIDNQVEAEATNESLNTKFYVTLYRPDYASGLEEGGYTVKGTAVLRSKPAANLEAAEAEIAKYKDEGLELEETGQQNVWRVLYDDDVELIAIETDKNRAQYHDPARSWIESEANIEPEKPRFNSEGRPVDASGRLIESVQLCTCPNCFEETFNDDLGLCTSCGYDEKSDLDD